MDFDRARECLLGVKFFSHHLLQHLVDSDICQEHIEISQKLTFVLELPKVSLESIEANDFGDTRDIHIFNLLSEISFRVFHDQANAGVKLLRIERFWDAHLQWSWGWLLWHLS